MQVHLPLGNCLLPVLGQQWLLIIAHWPLWGWLVALPVTNLSLSIILTNLLLNVICLQSNCNELLPYGLVHPFVFAFQMLRSKEVCNQMLFEGLIRSYC